MNNVYQTLRKIKFNDAHIKGTLNGMITALGKRDLDRICAFYKNAMIMFTSVHKSKEVLENS